VFRSTSLTDHGACKPSAAVNKVSTPTLIFLPPHQPATISLRGMCVEVKFHSKRHRAAYFSPSWTAFQADRGRCFSVMVDGISN